jgi:tetratricopeptide (TPR) repeat protein
MSDIFISYAHEDRSRAQMLAATLEGHGWSIFWDRTIPIGKTWRETIGRALNDARCVIVLWSKTSIESGWVQEEADDAKRRGVLVPILIENVQPPIGFRSIQVAHLVDWDGTESTQASRRLIADIAALIGLPPKKAKEEDRRSAAEVERKTEADAKWRADEEEGKATEEAEARGKAERKEKEKEKREPPFARPKQERLQETGLNIAGIAEPTPEPHPKPAPPRQPSRRAIVFGGIAAAGGLGVAATVIRRAVAPSPPTEQVAPPEPQPTPEPVQPPDAHAADDYLACYNATKDTSKTENSIAICTRLIDSGRWNGLELARLISNRAATYILAKKLDLAMADLDRVVAIAPDYVFAYDHRGDVWRLRGNNDKAIAEYTKAIKIDPNFLSAYYDRGQIYEAIKDLDKARADYQTAVDKPGDGRPLDAWAKDQARKALDRLGK